MLWISFIFGVAFVTANFLMQKFIIDQGFSEAQFTASQSISVISLLIAFGANSVLVEKVGRKPMLIFYSLMTPIAVIGLVILPTIGGFPILLIFMLPCNTTDNRGFPDFTNIHVALECWCMGCKYLAPYLHA